MESQPKAADSEGAAEKEDSEERSAPNGKGVYCNILEEGEGELKRSSPALFWSGLASGLSISFSMFMKGFLASHLSGTP